MPVISVVMPFFNSRRFISQAVASIRQQTFRDFELIAVDDGSCDGSSDAVSQHMAEDSRIRLVQSPHRGVAAARNIGVETARGMFIATMDADDISLPHRLLRQLQALNDEPRLVVVGGAYDVIDERGSVVSDKFPGHRKPITPYACRKTLEQGGCPLCASTTLLRREAIQQVGGYRSEMDFAEDYDLWLRLAKIGDISNVEEKVLQYRVHRASATFANSEIQFASILKAIIWDKGIHSNLEEKSTGQLLEIAAESKETAPFLVDRAIYPIEMAQLGYFSDAIRSAKVFSQYAADQDRPWVLQQFMMRAVFETAARQSPSLALWLLLKFVLSQKLRHAWLNRAQIGRLISALTQKIDCRTTYSPAPRTSALGGYLDSATWIDNGLTLLITGWAKFSDVGFRPTFLVHFPEPECRISIKRTIRSDVADVIGWEHLFCGFEIRLERGGQSRSQKHRVSVSIVSRSGIHFNLDDSNITVQ